jgi:hypothetical protein
MESPICEGDHHLSSKQLTLTVMCIELTRQSPSRTSLSGLWKKWLKDENTSLAKKSLYTQRSRGRSAQSFLIFISHNIPFSFVFSKKTF